MYDDTKSQDLLKKVPSMTSVLAFHIQVFKLHQKQWKLFWNMLKYGFKKVISLGMKLCCVGHLKSSKLDFPLIKTLERIRFSSNQNIGEGESNFDDWKCPTQQSFIPQEINS